MRKRDIEAILKEEANRFVPDGREEIKCRAVFPQKKKPGSAPRRKWYFAAAPIAAVLVIAVALTLAFALPKTGGGAGGGGQGVQIPFTESVVRVDINPSVKFGVGRKGLVTAQNACNKDGAILLMKKDFVGLEITAATAEVVELASKLGYLVPGKTVRLRVLNDDTELESDLIRELDVCVTNRLQTLSIQADVEAKGKNDVVEYLVAELGYERKAAEKLTAEDLEDVLEDAWDEDSAELDEYQTKISEGIEVFLKDYAESSEKIIKMLREVKPNGEFYELSQVEQESLADFCKRWQITEIEVLDKIEEDDFEELLENLSDEAKEAKEALTELQEEPDELSDVLEDFYERYKIYLKNDDESLDTLEKR